jgi:CRP/FNR family cyclic AMP-dependent transcriptional regulator
MGCLCKKLIGNRLERVDACIGSLWIFENLTMEEKQALAEAALKKPYNHGDVIFSQGVKADLMFLIKAGRVKLSKFTQDGNEIIFDIRRGGDFVGENIFSEDVDYPVTATCLEDTFTCGFSKSIFEQLVLKYPKIGLQVIKNMSRRMSWLSSHVESMALTTIVEKLYRSLLNVAEEYGTKSDRGFIVELPFTHEELSFLVGAHRVSITRAMKELKESGKVIQEGKKIILPPSKLN